MTRTVAQYLVQSLERLGVRHVFGIPGVHNLELYRALGDSTLTHVSARHEQGLGFMADGYARVSGMPGVCFTITGPGLTNIATAMGQAWGDSVPLLVVSTENVTTHTPGSGLLHELTDQFGIGSRLAAPSLRVTDPAMLPGFLAAAFARARRPRPAYLELPRDLLRRDASALPWPVPERPSPAAMPAQFAAASDRLAAARAPVIIAGGGASDCAESIATLAERLDAPLVMTTNARGLLPPGHRLAVPMSPSLEAVRTLCREADAVLALGTEFGGTDFDMYESSPFPTPSGLIRVDIDPAQLTRNVTPEVGIAADAAHAVAALLAALPNARGAHNGSSPGGARAARARAAALESLSAPMRAQIGLLDALRTEAPAAIVVGDSTQPVYAGNLGFAAARPRSWFNSATGFGALGYAVPAACGAALAAPKRPVICLVGDGGLQFTLGELAAARDLGAWLAVVVWQNQGYGEIKHSMDAAGIAGVGVDVRGPALPDLARAFGLAYQRIDSGTAWAQALRTFSAAPQLALMEFEARDFS